MVLPGQIYRSTVPVWGNKFWVSRGSWSHYRHRTGMVEDMILSINQKQCKVYRRYLTNSGDSHQFEILTNRRTYDYLGSKFVLWQVAQPESI